MTSRLAQSRPERVETLVTAASNVVVATGAYQRPKVPPAASRIDGRVLPGIAVHPYAALALATFFWSGNFIAGRALAGEIGPISLNFWRWAVALAVLLPASWRGLVDHRVAIAASWRHIAALGLTGVALFHTCVYFALAATPAVNALLLLSLTPVFIVLAAWLVHGERPSRREGTGIAISLAGAVVLVTHGDLAAVQALQADRGALWMVAALVAFAAYSILLRHRSPELPPLALHAASSIAGLAWMAPAYAIGLAAGETSALSWAGFLGIGYIALFASAVAFFLWIRAVAQIGPSRAGTFIHLMPVFGAALAAALLGERIAAFHVAGAALVFAGLFVSHRRA